MTNDLQYSMVIEWNPEDQCYVVLLPEWAGIYAMPVGDGATYEEAVASGRNTIESLIEMARQDNRALPRPKVYDAACSRGSICVVSSGVGFRADRYSFVPGGCRRRL
jgi:antitoxin HicB